MEDENDEHVPSWEEYGDELVGLLTHKEVEFDSVGDLACLEKLLEVNRPWRSNKYQTKKKKKWLRNLMAGPCRG
ncbi:hypothetical protein Hanom_Chr02g00143571 [Helianthus anomalus]